MEDTNYDEDWAIWKVSTDGTAEGSCVEVEGYRWSNFKELRFKQTGDGHAELELKTGKSTLKFEIPDIQKFNFNKIPFEVPSYLITSYHDAQDEPKSHWQRLKESFKRGFRDGRSN